VLIGWLTAWTRDDRDSRLVVGATVKFLPHSRARKGDVGEREIKDVASGVGGHSWFADEVHSAGAGPVGKLSSAMDVLVEAPNGLHGVCRLGNLGQGDHR